MGIKWLLRARKALRWMFHRKRQRGLCGWPAEVSGRHRRSNSHSELGRGDQLFSRCLPGQLRRQMRTTIFCPADLTCLSIILCFYREITQDTTLT